MLNGLCKIPKKDFFKIGRHVMKVMINLSYKFQNDIFGVVFSLCKMQKVGNIDDATKLDKISMLLKEHSHFQNLTLT